MFNYVGVIKKYADTGTRTKIFFFSEGYCYHTFNCLGRIKEYAYSGTRTTIVRLRRLLLARIQLLALRQPTVYPNGPVDSFILSSIASLALQKVNEI